MDSGWFGAIAGAIVAFCAFLGVSLRHEHRLTKNEENIRNAIERMRESTEDDKLWKIRMENMMNDQTRLLYRLIGGKDSEQEHKGEDKDR